MTNKNMSDAELIAKANLGDAEAFAALLERHYDLIFRLAFRTLANRQDAEDITQDICVSLAKKIRLYQGRAKFTTWLYQLTLNACRDLRRQMVTRQRNYADYREISVLRDEHNRQRQKDAEWAYSAIDTLPETLRETALLVVAEDLNHAQAGDILGVKESTVSWRMLKIREKLGLLAQTEVLS